MTQQPDKVHCSTGSRGRRYRKLSVLYRVRAVESTLSSFSLVVLLRTGQTYACHGHHRLREHYNVSLESAHTTAKRLPWARPPEAFHYASVWGTRQYITARFCCHTRNPHPSTPFGTNHGAERARNTYLLLDLPQYVNDQPTEHGESDRSSRRDSKQVYPYRLLARVGRYSSPRPGAMGSIAVKKGMRNVSMNPGCDTCGGTSNTVTRSPRCRS